LDDIPVANRARRGVVYLIYGDRILISALPGE
jgi:hypothetical protein